MEKTHSSRLHPVLWVAAVSVILLSLAGLGAIFGVIPTAGSKTADTSLSSTAPEPVTKLNAAAATAAEESAAKRPAEPTQAAKKAAPAPSKIAKAHTEAAPRKAASPAPVAAAPAACRDCGTIESVRAIEEKGEGSGLGAIAGGVVGGLLGNQVGGGTGKKIATVAGVAGGAYAGHQIEKNVRKTTHYEVVVRFEDGTSRVFTEAAEPTWRPGDHVRVSNGMLMARN